ncbi:MAG: Thiamine-monophosphate kinase [bacterium]|nr:Thiamine-monophosphate kinase [bacterium]
MASQAASYRGPCHDASSVRYDPIVTLDEAALLTHLASVLGPELIRQPLLRTPVFGDDAAICDLGGGSLVMTQDLLVEDVDFRRDWGSLLDVGYKAAQVNLSDLAAKGASPRLAFIGIAAPKTTVEADLDALYRGLREALTGTGVLVAGGDLSASPGPLMIDLFMIGELTGPAWLRNAARPGDVLWISRPVGWARLGLLAHERLLTETELPGLPEAVEAFRRPQAELTLSKALRTAGFLGACMDLSDGLVRDLPRLCLASGVGAMIDVKALNPDPVYASLASSMGEDPTSNALNGGEDFALLGACPPSQFEALLRTLPLIPIGLCTSDPALRISRDGIGHPWPAGGFDHFASPQGSAP